MKTKSAFSPLALVMLALLVCVGSSAQQKSAEPGVLTNPEVKTVVHFDVSPPLRDLAAEQGMLPFGTHQANPVQRPKLQKLLNNARHPVGPVQDPVEQDNVVNSLAASVGLNFMGVGNGFFGYSVPDAPTDDNLAVGDTQVLQWVNVQFAVFDKNTGANLLNNGQHYVSGNALWKGFPGRCANSNSGDIIAQWDKVAHRWVLHQPVFSAPYKACFAISTSPDALGTYYRYEFTMPNQNTDFPDYPKLGIWTDAYYQANNDFINLQSFGGVIACAYERAKMLVGDSSAKQVCFIDNSAGTLFDDSMLPADIDTPNSLPPKGMPEVYMGSIDNGTGGNETHMYKYLFHVDWTNTANSTFSCTNGACPITVAAYTIQPNPVEQPGGNVIDTLGDRLMYRLAYHRAPPSNPIQTLYQSFMVSHAVVANTTNTGVRWYEFRSQVATPTVLSVYQQGTYAPDSNRRMMSSLAMDKMGNIALGYTKTSSTVFPAVYFTGRNATDTLGTMQAEGLIYAGTGAQVGTSNRWGDYTSMAIDNDGCTFWYSNQYYITTAQFNWSTRIASLKFPNCK